MTELEFTELLKEYENILSDRKRFVGLLKDFIPAQPLQTNLLMMLYDINFHEEIENVPEITINFAFRFIKRLCDEYGVSKKNALWAVSIWCVCYGENILKKPCEITLNDSEIGINEKLSDVTSFPEESNITGNGIAAPEFNSGDWKDVYEYEIVNNCVIIKKYIAFDEDEIIVPQLIENCPVIEIGDEAFENCNATKQIYLPDTIKKIGNGSFRGCKAMSQIYLPDTIEKIGEGAFYSCGLQYINLPKKLIELGKYSLSFCPIDSIVIPQYVKYIEPHTFSYCTKLKKVTLSQNLKIIGYEAFESCSELKFIDIPESVEEIEYGAFIWCRALQSIRIPNSVIKLGKSEIMGNIFGNTSKPTIYCNIGSEALKYARENNFKIDKYENYREFGI